MLPLPSTTSATAKGSSSREKYIIFCSTPSSKTRKFSRLRSSAILPLSSRTVASTSTMLTSTFSVNPPVSGGGRWLPGAGPCAQSSAQRANAQKARVLAANAHFITHRQDSLESSPSTGCPDQISCYTESQSGSGCNTARHFHYACGAADGIPHRKVGYPRLTELIAEKVSFRVPELPMSLRSCC